MTKALERTAEDLFDDALEASPESLDQLADEALAEHRAGNTESLYANER